MTNPSPGHVILPTNGRLWRAAGPPRANGNCRLLVDDSSSTDGQLEEEGEREGFDQDPVTKGAF